MNTSNVGPVVSRSVLEMAPHRAVTFLRTLGIRPQIRSLLVAAGYTHKDHVEGWKLLSRVLGAPLEATPPPAAPNEARLAIEEIEGWQRAGFLRARAALRSRFAAQAQFLFLDLAAARGPAALVSMTTFLDRCDALDVGPERRATRKADHAALALLEQRGIGTAVRAHLRERLDAASVDAKAPAPLAAPDAAEAAKRHDALVALHGWLREWSDTARAVVTRRDQQIQLGIARRRPKAKPPAVGVVSAPAPTSDEDLVPQSRAA